MSDLVADSVAERSWCVDLNVGDRLSRCWCRSAKNDEYRAEKETGGTRLLFGAIIHRSNDSQFRVRICRPGTTGVNRNLPGIVPIAGDVRTSCSQGGPPVSV